MSRNGTMDSKASNQVFQQQQQQLQELQTLENNYNAYQQARSLTSADRRVLQEVVVGDQPAQQQQQQFPSQQQLNSLGSTAHSTNRFANHQPVASRVLSNFEPQARNSFGPSASNTGLQDLRNPLAVSVPTNGNPTEVLAARFAAWRTIVAALLQYLTEVVSIQDEVVRQQVRLSHAVNFSLFQSDTRTGSSTNQNRASQRASSQATHHGSSSTGAQTTERDDGFQANFFVPQGNGSVQDLPQILVNYHASSAALAQRASKELNTTVVPRLEDLRRELLVKIKEIKGLNSDFKNSVQKELAQTKHDLQAYNKSLEDAKSNPQSILPKNDPYLTKIILDRQIKKQLTEENYLHEAYNNLQSSGKELEKVVVIEVQNALTVFAKVMAQEAQNVFDKLISNLEYGFLTKPPSFEWEQFIAKDKNFIDENLPKRDYKSVQYDKINDPLAFEVRSSFLEKRSKFLKSYSRGFYVLTPTFFHEFKSADRKKDLIPILSLSLDEIELEDHSNQGSKDYKFVLKKVGRVSSHKYIFRAESSEVMRAWYNDIKALKSLSSPVSRGVYASKHHTAKISRVSSTATSRVMRNSMANDSNDVDTILTGPNNNQRLPTSDDSPLPARSLMNSDAVYVKQLGAESTPQSQRLSVPVQGYQQQQQQIPQQQQRYSLQLQPQQQYQAQLSQQQQQQYQPHEQQQQAHPQFSSPQQQYRTQQNTAPYPQQAIPQQILEQQFQQVSMQDQQQQQSSHSFVQAPQLYVEPAASIQATTPKGPALRDSVESYRSQNGEPDGSGFSEDTMGTSTAKETHEAGEEYVYHATSPKLNGKVNGKVTQFH